MVRLQLNTEFQYSEFSVEEVLDLASKWEMKSVLAKYEQFLIRTRSYGQEASIKNVKLADKFKMKSLFVSSTNYIIV